MRTDGRMNAKIREEALRTQVAGLGDQANVGPLPMVKQRGIPRSLSVADDVPWGRHQPEDLSGWHLMLQPLHPVGWGGGA